MKLSDWKILHCVRRPGKEGTGGKAGDVCAHTVDIVPLYSARTGFSRRRKIEEMKEEKEEKAH